MYAGMIFSGYSPNGMTFVLNRLHRRLLESKNTLQVSCDVHVRKLARSLLAPALSSFSEEELQKSPCILLKADVLVTLERFMAESGLGVLYLDEQKTFLRFFKEGVSWQVLINWLRRDLVLPRDPRFWGRCLKGLLENLIDRGFFPVAVRPGFFSEYEVLSELNLLRVGILDFPLSDEVSPEVVAMVDRSHLFFKGPPDPSLWEPLVESIVERVLPSERDVSVENAV